MSGYTRFLLLLLFVATVTYSTDISTCAYTISSGGTYVVTTNLACTGNGITISADNVVLNLNGKTVDGDDGTSDIGITISANADNVIIENGTLTDFGQGISAAGTSTYITIRNLSISSMAGSSPSGQGIRMAVGASTNIQRVLLQNLTIFDNADAGIFIGQGSAGSQTIDNITIRDSNLRNNAGAAQIRFQMGNGQIINNSINGWNTAIPGIKMGYSGQRNVTSNTIFNSTAEAIYINTPEGSGGRENVSLNTISNVGTGILVEVRTTGLYTSGNNITNVTTAMNLGTTGSMTAGNFNNDIIKNSITGIRLATFSDVNFTSLQVYNASSYINQTTAGTTNWVDVTFGANTTNGNLDTGKIRWDSFALTNATEISQAVNVYIQYDWVSVDITNLSMLASPANLTLLTDTGCINTSIAKANGFPTTKGQVIAGGFLFGIANCTSGIATFNVTSFSGYTISTDIGGVWILPVNEYPLTGAPNISVIMNVTFYDESNLSVINIDSASLNFEVFPGNVSNNRNFSIVYSGTGAIANATIKAYPDSANATINSIETYSKANYTSRTRFFISANTYFNVQQNISVYLLPSASASYAIMNVIKNGVPQGGVYVSLLKYFGTTSSYTLVDQKITNNDGVAAGYYDIISYYKFIVYDPNGNQLYISSQPEQFICTSSGCEITINIANLIPLKLISPYATKICYGNNATNTITFSYADAAGLTSSINFLAYRENQQIPVCNYTVDGTSGGYNCVLSAPENLSSYLYSCEVWRSASPPLLDYVALIDLRTIAAVTDWFLAAIAIVVTLGGSSISLPIGIGLAAISLFILSALNLVQINIGVSIPIMIVGLVLAFLLSKRGND